jgi:hypothetical protein
VEEGEVMELIWGYFVVTGTAAALLQAARGLVRGYAKLVEGDTRAAVAEVAGSLVAPACSVAREAGKLAQDALACAWAIAADNEKQKTQPSTAPSGEPAARNAPRAASANGAAV